MSQTDKLYTVVKHVEHMNKTFESKVYWKLKRKRSMICPNIWNKYGVVLDVEISEKTSIVCGHFQILLIKSHLEMTSDHTHHITYHVAVADALDSKLSIFKYFQFVEFLLKTKVDNIKKSHETVSG